VRLLRALPVPLVAALAAVGAWHAAVVAFSIPAYLVPPPAEVALRLLDDWRQLGFHAAVTLAEALGGFALAAVFGVLAAAILVWSPSLERAVMPVLLVIQTFPKIALAPLIVIWFGLGVGPKLLISFLVAVFPVLVSAIVGLRSVEKDMLDLARATRAPAWRIFWRVRLPFALPHIFGGLKVAVAFSVVGAVVGEWVGADRGLGYLLLWANANLDTALLFAILAWLAAIGLALYYAVEAAERLALPWHVSMRGRDLPLGT
jgi:NitT/TauT family transport system permease protein